MDFVITISTFSTENNCILIRTDGRKWKMRHFTVIADLNVAQKKYLVW